MLVAVGAEVGEDLTEVCEGDEAVSGEVSAGPGLGGAEVCEDDGEVGERDGVVVVDVAGADLACVDDAVGVLVDGVDLCVCEVDGECWWRGASLGWVADDPSPDGRDAAAGIEELGRDGEGAGLVRGCAVVGVCEDGGERCGIKRELDARCGRREICLGVEGDGDGGLIGGWGELLEDEVGHGALGDCACGGSSVDEGWCELADVGGEVVVAIIEGLVGDLAGVDLGVVVAVDGRVEEDVERVDDEVGVTVGDVWLSVAIGSDLRCGLLDLQCVVGAGRSDAWDAGGNVVEEDVWV